MLHVVEAVPQRQLQPTSWKYHLLPCHCFTWYKQRSKGDFCTTEQRCKRLNLKSKQWAPPLKLEKASAASGQLPGSSEVPTLFLARQETCPKHQCNTTSVSDITHTHTKIMGVEGNTHKVIPCQCWHDVIKNLGCCQQQNRSLFTMP